LIERRRHRPDASRDRLPSRTAGRRAQINRAGVVAFPCPARADCPKWPNAVRLPASNKNLRMSSPFD
jgi:hypothetical protein